jgi:phage gp36-like protein
LDAETLRALADDDADGVADDAVIAAALADATAEINVTLAARYAVGASGLILRVGSGGVEEIPPPLRRLAADLAVAHLFRRRRETPAPEQEAQAVRARDLLRQLANGTALLVGVAPRTLPAATRQPQDKATRPATMRNL